MREHAIVLGKDGGDHILFPGTEHVALYAKTRSGKTTSFCIPNCFCFGGSLVVLDIKGQIFRATAGHRARMGQQVYLLDPAATDGRTHRWNPLDAVDRTSWDRFDQISRLGFMLFPEASAAGGGTTNTDKFWDPAGRAAYTAAATLVAETPELAFNQETVLRLFARGDGTDVMTRLIRERRQAGGHQPQYSQAVVDGISDYLSGNLEQVEGIRKTVSTRLQPWFNPRIAAATRTSDFDLRDLRRRPMTIYVAVTPGNMSRMRPYLALFFEQLVNLNVDKTPEEDPTIQHQALIMLDEFSRLGRMETLAEAAQFAAGYGMRFAYVIQNKAQVEARYGKASAVDIFDNTGAEIIFGTNDLATTEEVSKRFGDDTTTAITAQRPRFWSSFQWQKQSEAEHLHRRPAMLAQEVARLPRDRQIILRAGMLPMLTARRGWFEDPEMRQLYCDPPTIPKLGWSVPLDDGQTRVMRPRLNTAGDTLMQDEDPVVQE